MFRSSTSENGETNVMPLETHLAVRLILRTPLTAFEQATMHESCVCSHDICIWNEKLLVLPYLIE
jgi:hypothetical protein